MAFDLNTPLFSFPDSNEPIYRFIHAVQGMQGFGSVGSGKSSALGKFWFCKLISHGCGALVLTAKPDEKDNIMEYCRMAGRSKDVVVIEPGGKEYFNFLEYESTRNSGKTFTANLVELLQVVIGREESNSNSDRFWEESLRLLLASCIDVALFAHGKVTVNSLYEIAQSVMDASEDSAFTKAMLLAADNINGQIRSWREEMGEAFLDSLPADVYNEALFEEVPDARAFNIVKDFFLQTYRKLSERTRSTITMSLISFLIGLLRDPFYTLFCSKSSTITPEDIYRKGKILIVNLPVKLFHKVGQDIQKMVKYSFQRAWEKRDLKENDTPIVLYADESHLFIHEHDTEFQATARSSRVCTVYLSQNIMGYHANMGGSKSEYRVKGFLATMGTKVFLYNSDVSETNKYASDLFGESYSIQETETITATQDGTSHAVAKVAALSATIRPEEFTILKGGGEQNNYKVTGYIHVQGMRFASGFSHRKIVFDQLFQP